MDYFLDCALNALWRFFYYLAQYFEKMIDIAKINEVVTK